MKYIKTFEEIEIIDGRIAPTRWNNKIDLNYIKNNPDDKSEESDWIKSFNLRLEEIDDQIKNPKIFSIINIKGQTFYNEGPIAIVSIFGERYEVIEVDYPDDDGLKIEGFPLDNTSEYGYSAGFTGTEEEIVEMIDGINDSGSVEAYRDSKKFNL